MFKNVIKKYKRYKKRLRNFFSSSISGLFTGAAIAIFFSLITNSNFNRWIDIRSYEIVAGIIYVFFTYFLLFIFYYLGKGLIFLVCFFFKIKNKKEDILNFKINFFAGVYSAFFVAPLIILKGHLNMQLTIGIIFVLFYFPFMYLVIRNTKK